MNIKISHQQNFNVMKYSIKSSLTIIQKHISNKVCLQGQAINNNHNKGSSSSMNKHNSLLSLYWAWLTVEIILMKLSISVKASCYKTGISLSWIKLRFSFLLFHHLDIKDSQQWVPYFSASSLVSILCGYAIVLQGWFSKRFVTGMSSQNSDCMLCYWICLDLMFFSTLCSS